MRIWCIPSATTLESPRLPPRIDRDVFFRSPPPPPRLSKQEKLARGVIVLKPRKNKAAKNTEKAKPSETKDEVRHPPREPRKVRYADLSDYGPIIEQKSSSNTQPQPVTPRPPSRGTEIVHSRQQSNTSGTSSSCLGTGSNTSPGSATSPHYSSSSGRGSRGSSGEMPSPSPLPGDTSSPQSTLTSYKSARRHDRCAKSSRPRVKKTTARSTLSMSVGGFMKKSRECSTSCDNLILFPGVSRTRDRRERGRGKHKRKGVKKSKLNFGIRFFVITDSEQPFCLPLNKDPNHDISYGLTTYVIRHKKTWATEAKKMVVISEHPFMGEISNSHVT
jgi:hypothetical protein